MAAGPSTTGSARSSRRGSRLERGERVDSRGSRQCIRVSVKAPAVPRAGPGCDCTLDSPQGPHTHTQDKTWTASQTSIVRSRPVGPTCVHTRDPGCVEYVLEHVLVSTPSPPSSGPHQYMILLARRRVPTVCQLPHQHRHWHRHHRMMRCPSPTAATT